MQNRKGREALKLAIVAGYALMCASPSVQAQEVTTSPTETAPPKDR